jgi:ABC-type branched-subunit amino acid transport system ATPase component
MSSVILEARNLSVNFGGIAAVERLSFAVGRGEVFGVIGPNGAGKSTLLNAVSRLVKLSAGEVMVDGIDVGNRAPHKMAKLGIARTFQAAEVFNDFRVVDYLMLGRFSSDSRSMIAASLRLPSVRRREAQNRSDAIALLRRFQVASVATGVLGELPYGVRKLIDVLRALMGNPRLLLLDEPTSGTALDDRVLLREVVGEARSREVTVVLVDHDVAFVSDVCDRLLVMNFGCALGIGTPQDVLSRIEVQKAYTGLGVDGDSGS